MVKKLMIIICVALLSTTVVAGDFSKVGTAGAQFLKIGVGARYHGLGEASVAVADDIYSLYWNPAGLSGLRASQVAFTHVNYIADINLNYIAYAGRLNSAGVFGVSATMLSMGDQEITTVDQPDGTGEMYTATSFALQFSYARDLTTRFSFGASLKYIREEIHRETANGWGVDFGTMLYTGLNNLRIAMNISNMGPEMSFAGPDLDVNYTPDENDPNQDDFVSRLKVDPYDLPLTFRVGLAYNWLFGDNYKLLMAIEAKHPSDNLQQGSIGSELDWRETYFLRAGYKFNYDEEGLGLGAGFRTGVTETTDLILDYAWVDFGRLNSVHRFSASITF